MKMKILAILAGQKDNFAIQNSLSFGGNHFSKNHASQMAKKSKYFCICKKNQVATQPISANKKIFCFVTKKQQTKVSRSTKSSKPALPISNFNNQNFHIHIWQKPNKPNVLYGETNMKKIKHVVLMMPVLFGATVGVSSCFLQQQQPAISTYLKNENVLPLIEVDGVYGVAKPGNKQIVLTDELMQAVSELSEFDQKFSVSSFQYACNNFNKHSKNIKFDVCVQSKQYQDFGLSVANGRDEYIPVKIADEKLSSQGVAGSVDMTFGFDGYLCKQVVSINKKYLSSCFANANLQSSDYDEVMKGSATRTIVEHEIGHLLGFADIYYGDKMFDMSLMRSTLDYTGNISTYTPLDIRSIEKYNEALCPSEQNSMSSESSESLQSLEM